MRKAIAVLLACLAALTAVADSTYIRLTPFPTLSVADGRSTITITAEVRDSTGKIVPNGTRIVFTTDIGTFRESIVETTDGIARTVLVASSNPGTAKITAAALAYKATATLDYEFVADRSLLSTAKEYIEVTAPQDLSYSVDLKMMGGSGPGKEVVVRYKDIEIRADDLQVKVPTSEVIAKNATLKIGRQEFAFGELYFRLGGRRGFGTTTFKDYDLTLVPSGRAFAFKRGQERSRYGMREVSSAGLTAPSGEVPKALFEFAEISDSATVVTAKKAVAYPRKEIQFHKADVYIGGARVLRMPLYVVKVYGQSPVLTDEILNVNDNQLAVNYPHYLSLKPGQTSLLRFRTGQGYGRGIGANKGMFLDYELNWNRGDDMQGELLVQGINRQDWGITARQYIRINDTTNFNAQIDMPAHKSILGSSSLTKQFNGFSVSLNGSTTHTLSGPSYSNQQVGLVAEKDPTKVGKLPIRMFYGLTATHQQGKDMFSEQKQTSMGARVRFQSLPIYFDKSTSLSSELTISKLFGPGTLGGLAYMGSASLSKQLSSDASILLTYNFIDDGFNSLFSGKHQLGARGYYSKGALSFNASMTKGLDIDRLSYYLDASYRLNRDFRLSYAYTYERFLGSGYLDYNFVLGYRIGFREFGLTWSNKTKRFGIQVLGAAFN